MAETRKLEHIVGVAFQDSKSAVPTSYDSSSILAGVLRDAIGQVGLGISRPDAPLADLIKPGMTVLLKPNWVFHRNGSRKGMDCMITHPNFILAVLKEVLAAQPERVILGDAPIQGCDWGQVVTEDLRRKISMLAKDCHVEIIDFRRTILNRESLTDGVKENVRGESRYIRFDLGKDSLLEPISAPAGRFRVTMYDSRKLSNSHHNGSHQYLLSREAFEADVIINLPKLKTHGKAGLTGALKNLVGLNGNKEYLPHHRVGGSALGGDCYPGFSPVKRYVEYCLDRANQNIGTPTYAKWTTLAYRLLNAYGRFGDKQIEGGWYGNDTIWRMVLDLNRILVYGTTDGAMMEGPQRQIWSLTDGIICGEGDGPLAPEPRFLGAVTFSGSAVAADIVHAALFRFDPHRIPLLRESMKTYRWPLAQDHRTGIVVRFQNGTLTVNDVADKLGTNIKPPSGWIKHCEMLR